MTFHVTQFPPSYCYQSLSLKYSPQRCIFKHFQYKFFPTIEKIILHVRQTEALIFRVLLTVHLSIILVTDQLNAQIIFYNKFIIFL